MLNGSNSRFLNLHTFLAFEKQKEKDKGKKPRYKVKTKIDPVTGLPLKVKVEGKELPFFQIGAEQGYLPNVVEIGTGYTRTLLGNGKKPDKIKAASSQQGLLMAPAERADVIVDFSKFKHGMIIRMINTAPDAPFGGLPDIPADPGSTGQIMEFVIDSTLLQPSDALTTSPYNLNMAGAAEGPLGIAVNAANPRQLSLNEEESSTVCVDALTLDYIPGAVPPACIAPGGAIGVPMAPKAALLGLVNTDAAGNPVVPPGAASPGIPLLWGAGVTEQVAVGDIETWEINNYTVDAHPIHLHLVRFEVVDRQLLDPITFAPVGLPLAPQPWEMGFKDTVIAYPGEVTRVRAAFDNAGLYVWHCHIVEHEDNEMMRPYCVMNADGTAPANCPL